MKKAKLKIPINLSDKFASWLIDKEINVVISWSTPAEFFEPGFLFIVITFSEAQQPEVETWKQYFKPLSN
jgi:hypothetical protein